MRESQLKFETLGKLPIISNEYVEYKVELDVSLVRLGNIEILTNYVQTLCINWCCITWMFYFSVISHFDLKYCTMYQGFSRKTSLFNVKMYVRIHNEDTFINMKEHFVLEKHLLTTFPQDSQCLQHPPNVPPWMFQSTNHICTLKYMWIPHTCA